MQKYENLNMRFEVIGIIIFAGHLEK